MVDSANHKVRTAMFQELVERQLHTVYRCSAARPHLHILAHVVASLEAQRRGSREGAGESGTGTFGSHNQQVAPVLEEAHERFNTIGMIAIIIRN